MCGRGDSASGAADDDDREAGSLTLLSEMALAASRWTDWMEPLAHDMCCVPAATVDLGLEQRGSQKRGVGRKATRGSKLGRLKGLPRAKIAADAPALLECVTLTSVKDKAAGTYSGGMKRRLSVAVAYPRAG